MSAPNPAAGPLTTFLLNIIDKHAIGRLKTLWDRTRIESAARGYLTRYQDAYGVLKPLGISEPIPLDKIYTEVQLTSENLRQHFSAEKIEKVARGEMQKLFNRDRLVTMNGIVAANKYQRLMVLGHPGGGKSTYLRRIGWECLRSYSIARNGFSGTPKYDHEVLPILLELKTCRTEETRSLIELMAAELGHCGFPESVELVKYLANAGKLLFLLDALDEVSSTKLESVVAQAQEIVRDYPTCRMIVSCRIAFHQRSFPTFQDVTLLDFTDAQISSFIGNWFSSAEHRKNNVAESFWERLQEPGNQSTLELARSPVLLGLLCVSYQGNLTLPSSRAEVYRLALDTFLLTWNAHQQKTVHAEQVHPSLPHDQELAMLAAIAYQATSCERFFLTEDEWLQGIRNHIAELVDKPRAVSAQQILYNIAVRQGLVVQRTDQHWSFSHLTIQEYLTAWHVCQNDLIPEVVRSNLHDTHWQEIFLIVSGMKAEKLIPLMHSAAHDAVTTLEPTWECFRDYVRSLRMELKAADGTIHYYTAELLAAAIYLNSNSVIDRVILAELGHAIDPNLDLEIIAIRARSSGNLRSTKSSKWPVMVTEGVALLLDNTSVLKSSVQDGNDPRGLFQHSQAIQEYFRILVLILRCKNGAFGLKVTTWERVLKSVF